MGERPNPSFLTPQGPQGTCSAATVPALQGGVPSPLKRTQIILTTLTIALVLIGPEVLNAQPMSAQEGFCWVRWYQSASKMILNFIS